MQEHILKDNNSVEIKLCIFANSKFSSRIRFIVEFKSSLCFQGMVKLVLETIDKISIYKSARDFATIAGEEAGRSWEDILTYLYQLLGELSAILFLYFCSVQIHVAKPRLE